jgi:DNA repair protein RadC
MSKPLSKLAERAAPRNRFMTGEAVAHYALPIQRLPLDPAVMTREDRLIARARKVLAQRLTRAAVAIDSPIDVREFLLFELAEEAREVFHVTFLDAQNRVIAFEPMFVGTLSQTSVHPREVVRRCIELGAAAVILAHNHPSGMANPSCADKEITVTLVNALALIDVRVLDHFIVAGAAKPLSFAEQGLMPGRAALISAPALQAVKPVTRRKKL